MAPWLLAQHPRRGKTDSIFVGDPALVDSVVWTRMVMDGNRSRFITCAESNMNPTVHCSYFTDADKPILEGVQADLSVGPDGAMTLRIIRYRDPESVVEYEFLT